MISSAVKYDRIYTYKDYLTWHDDRRWEIINGSAYSMTPAPSPKHQRILLVLSKFLDNFFQSRKCNVYIAPFDVRLSENAGIHDDKILDIVQPDISVICDSGKIDDRGCTGAPDLIVEILSPATAKKDFNEKFNLYEKRGVGEYWIVDPANEMIHQFRLNDKGRYEAGTLHEKQDTIKSALFNDLKISLRDVFDS